MVGTVPRYPHSTVRNRIKLRKKSDRTVQKNTKPFETKWNSSRESESALIETPPQSKSTSEIEPTGVEYGEMRCENRGEKEKEKGETCHKKCQTKLSPIDQSLSLIP